MENWKPVVGYEGVYEASDIGNIRRVGSASGTRPGRILKPYLNRYGYMTVALSHHSRVKWFRVHRLVATAFLGEPPFPDADVNHKNGSKTDNSISNLEWCTRSENLLHSYRVIGRNTKWAYGERCASSKLSDQQIVAIRSEYAGNQITQRELARKYKVTQSTIGAIVRGETWQHVCN